MEPRNRNAEEIDLLYFFNPLFRGLKKLSTAFKKYLLTLGRNFILFAGILFTIAALGYVLRYILPKSYQTSAIFVSYNLPANWCVALINNLNGLTGTEQKAGALAEQLDISLVSASAIQSVSAGSIENLSDLEPQDSSASPFKIDLLVRHEKAIPEIQNGLQNFLESNPFSVKRKEAKRKKLEELRKDLVMRINNLDSLKEVLSRNLVSRGQGILLGVPVSPVEAYKVQQEYYEQQKDIEEKLALLQNIEVVQPFLTAQVPNYPNFSQLFLYAILIGLIAALLLTPVLGKR